MMLVRVVCFVSEYNTERDEPIIIGCKAAIKMSCFVALPFSSPEQDAWLFY